MEEIPVPVGEVDNLHEQIQILQNENKKMHAEFNIQRAKLKELFLQKETEVKNVRKDLDEMKSQFLVAECKQENQIQLIDRKAQEEVSSLQQLVHETIEESTILKSELEKLHEECGRLRQENRELREEILERQQESSLAPVFSHVKKTLAKKLGGDNSGSLNHDSLDDSMRKVNKYAQEDAEFLRSLVVPLEEEVKALKEKLRSTDEELQTFRHIPQPLQNSTHFPISDNIEVMESTSSQNQQIEPVTSNIVYDGVSKSTSAEFKCDMCKLMEDKYQKLLTDSQLKIDNLQKLLEDSKDDLKKEAALRHDLENQWQEKREAHKEEIQLLTEQVKTSEKDLQNLQEQFFLTKEEIQRQLYSLTNDRLKIDNHLNTLQNDNDFLSGRYLETAHELDSQNINLPNNVEELQELFLRQKNDLIQARIGFEFEKRKHDEKCNEAQIYRDQFETVAAEKKSFLEQFQIQTKSWEERFKNQMLLNQTHETMKDKYERKEVEMNKQIAELRVQIIELQDANEKLDRAKSDMKSKMKNLQDDLATSEHVQKDFVKLSQSLQIALEKFRQAETQVRWQDDEDVDKCPHCNVLFTVTCRKQHCRHCGTIYCEKCLTKTVPSGPRQKLARVCDICHTLLTPNTAPYFSQQAPNSPV